MILNCSVAHFSSVRTVIWKRDGTTVIATDRVTVSESLLVLGLASVHVADAGFYKCEVEDQLTHFTANMTFRLAVLGRLAIDSITTPQTVLLNTRLLLKCTVSGFPQPRVTWHHTVSNGCNVEREKCYMVKSDGNLLLTITLAQMGRYYCMANNTIQKVEKMTNVSVIQGKTSVFQFVVYFLTDISYLDFLPRVSLHCLVYLTVSVIPGCGDVDVTVPSLVV